MASSPNDDQSLIISYLRLRVAVGFLGIAFPLIMAIGGYWLSGIGLQRSISAYYYTVMGDFFVGILFMIGGFLFSYTGYETIDNILGTLECIFAVGTAVFPTSADPMQPTFVGNLHLVFAALMFLTLVYYSLFLFTRTHPDEPPTPKKLQRNKVYRASGYTMLACIILIGLHSFLPRDIQDSLDIYRPIFWLEAVILWAFGIAWFVKGETILKDE